MNDRKFSRLLLIGGNTDDGGKGISVYGFNTSEGSAEYLNSYEINNPLGFVPGHGKNFLYSLSGEDGSGAYVNAFSFNASSGQMTFLNREKVQESPVSCIAYYNGDGHIICGGNGISVFYTDIDGTVSKRKQYIEFDYTVLNKQSTGNSFISSMVFSPDAKFLYASDHDSDCIYRFSLDSKQEGSFLNENSKTVFQLDPDAGPLRLVFHPAKRYLYLLNEYTSSVMVLTHHDGVLEPVQTIETDPRESGTGTGITVSQDGHFLFASQKGGRSGIAAFGIDAKTGMLEKLGFYDMEEEITDLVFSPEGGHLLAASGNAGIIRIFETDGFTGRLSEGKKHISVDSPVTMTFI